MPDGDVAMSMIHSLINRLASQTIRYFTQNRTVLFSIGFSFFCDQIKVEFNCLFNTTLICSPAGFDYF